MRAAVVEQYDQPPRCGEWPEPVPGPGEIVVHVAAAALSNLVKAQAAGKHYSSPQPPFVPGNDGAGRTSDGERVYFLGPRAPFGSLAERTVVAREHILALPDGLDDATAAALGNPGLASWGALLGRARLQRGENVLVHGGTGVSGQQAIQVARYLGAGRIVATGRDPRKLAQLRALGADATIDLTEPEAALRSAFRRALRDEGGTQVVLDYLYGPSAALLLSCAGGHGSPEGEPRIRYVQIGSAAGRTAELSAEWFRSSGLELLGSGLGSLSTPAILHSLRAMFAAWSSGRFTVQVDPRPLRAVHEVWTATEPGRRTVLLPGA